MPCTGIVEKEKVTQQEKYHMGGDLSKAPKTSEGMLQDLGELQAALHGNQPSSSAKEEEPLPEVVELQKLLGSVKLT